MSEAVTIIGLDRFNNAVQAMILGVQGVPDIVGRRIVNEAIPDYFADEKSPDGESWAALNPAYDKKKTKKYGSGKQKLEASGNLQKSVGYKTEGLNVILRAGDGDTKEYANIHNEGGFAGRNKSAYIPKREYLGCGDREEKIIDETIKRYVLNQFK